MRTSDFERLQNIAETTIKVKKLTGIQYQPIAPNRSANPKGTEVHTQDRIFHLQDGELIECSLEYEE